MAVYFWYLFAQVTCGVLRSRKHGQATDHAVRKVTVKKILKVPVALTFRRSPNWNYLRARFRSRCAEVSPPLH
jgi:hypothetical protein